MVLVGRCIIGLGAARAINRRYNSDWTNDTDYWNAIFVTVTALGMSLGLLSRTLQAGLYLSFQERRKMEITQAIFCINISIAELTLLSFFLLYGFYSLLFCA